MDILLSINYLPPVQYFTKLISGEKIFIEQHENYNRQSFRNRCEIFSANGKVTLSIPVQKEKNQKTAIKDVLINYSTNWQKLHWKALEASYRSSPFYEFYVDDLEKYYFNKYKYLWDFNLELLNIIIENIGIEVELLFTNKYNKSTKICEDYRDSIHPKNKNCKQDVFFNPLKYKQVFDDKYSFISNLSIIDLLFNEGPNTIEILKQSII